MNLGAVLRVAHRSSFPGLSLRGLDFRRELAAAEAVEWLHRPMDRDLDAFVLSVALIFFGVEKRLKFEPELHGRMAAKIAGSTRRGCFI